MPTASLPVLHSLSYLCTDIWHCWPPTCRCHSTRFLGSHSTIGLSPTDSSSPGFSQTQLPTCKTFLTTAASILMPPKTFAFPILEAESQETWEKVRMVRKAWDRKPVPGAKFWLDQDEAHRRTFYNVFFCHSKGLPGRAGSSWPKTCQAHYFLCLFLLQLTNC